MKLCFGGSSQQGRSGFVVSGSAFFLLCAVAQTCLLLGSLYISCETEFNCSLFIPTLSYLAAYRGYDRVFSVSYTLYALVLLLFFLSAHFVYQPFTRSCTQSAMLVFAVLACLSLPAVAVVDEMSSSYLVQLDYVHRCLVGVLCASSLLWALMSLCGMCSLRRTLTGAYRTEQRLLAQYLLIAVLATAIAGYIWLCQFYNAVNWLITDFNAAIAEWFAVLIATFIPYCYSLSFPGFTLELAFRTKSEKRED